MSVRLDRLAGTGTASFHVRTTLQATVIVTALKLERNTSIKIVATSRQ
jgi:hypothetical protein